MGLDVSVWSNQEYVHRDWLKCEWGNHVAVHSSSGFPERRDGMREGCYTANLVHEFKAGSYSGYGWFRSQLSLFALGVPSVDVWKNAERFSGQPFYNLVAFCDNEGILGPKTCAKLSADFEQHGRLFETYVPIVLDDNACDGTGKPTSTDKTFRPVEPRRPCADEDVQFRIYNYNQFAKSFRLAAKHGGFVEFH